MLPGHLRAVVSDLDGTIILLGSQLTPATIAAVHTLRDSGIAFIPATGRTPAGLRVLGPLLPDVSAAVCCNGAIGLGQGGERVLWQERLDSEVVADLAALLSSGALDDGALDDGGLGGGAVSGAGAPGGGAISGGGMAVYDGHGWLVSPEYAASLGRLHAGRQQVVPQRELSKHPASLLAVYHREIGTPDLAAALVRSGLFDGRATITYAADQIVNIGPAGVDKGTGARRALESLGIPDTAVVGFGDAPNDVALAGSVGWFVAVGSADPAVLAVADEITGAAADDGVAAWLARAGLDLTAGEAQPV